MNGKIDLRHLTEPKSLIVYFGVNWEVTRLREVNWIATLSLHNTPWYYHNTTWGYHHNTRGYRDNVLGYRDTIWSYLGRKCGLIKK